MALPPCVAGFQCHLRTAAPVGSAKIASPSSTRTRCRPTARWTRAPAPQSAAVPAVTFWSVSVVSFMSPVRKTGRPVFFSMRFTSAISIAVARLWKRLVVRAAMSRKESRFTVSADRGCAFCWARCPTQAAVGVQGAQANAEDKVNNARMIGLTVSILAGCGPAENLVTAAGLVRPVVHPRQKCSDGPLRSPTGAGDQELCAVPQVTCDAAEDIQSTVYCHFPPSPSPTQTCCEPRPVNCSPTDCDCLLREGPWIDSALAEAAGTSLAGYNGPKAKCSYRVNCTPAPDGGVAVLVCTPA